MWTIDLADLDALETFAAEVSLELGGLDVLVNNAGIPKRRNVMDLDPETVESVMAINYFSPVRLMLAFLPELIERSGRIVNISSVAARLGPPGEAAYTASKAALTGFSESMQVDLGIAGHDVQVHVVNPGRDRHPACSTCPTTTRPWRAIEALPASAMVEPVLDRSSMPARSRSTCRGGSPTSWAGGSPTRGHSSPARSPGRASSWLPPTDRHPGLARQSKRSGCSAVMTSHRGWNENQPAACEPTCRAVASAQSASISTGVPAASARSCA